MSAHSRRQIVRVDLAFFIQAERPHFSPPTRRAIANTARQHGAAVRSTGCTPYHILHTSDTHVDYTQTQVRGGTSGWWWAQRKRPVRRVGAQNARRRHWSFRAPKCQVPLGARFTPLGSNTRTRRRCFSESTRTKAMLLTAHVLRMLFLPSAGSSLIYSLCGQIVIQRRTDFSRSVALSLIL